MIGRLAALSHALAAAMTRIAAVGLVAMTGIVCWQVFGRYVLGSSPSWSEEAALTLMIWYVALAAAAGVREGFHIRIVAAEEAAPPPLRRIMRIVANAVVGACGVVLLAMGTELVVRTWTHVMPSLGLPRGLAYLGMPIAGGLIVLFAVERIATDARGQPDADGKDARWS